MIVVSHPSHLNISTSTTRLLRYHQTLAETIVDVTTTVVQLVSRGIKLAKTGGATNRVNGPYITPKHAAPNSRRAAIIAGTM